MKINAPRKGSLQFWPRKRANKFLPSVNWKAINSDKKLKGFICYKAGMMSAIVTDNTPDSMTKGKQKAIPVTILQCPTMKIFSIRFYKGGIVATEVLSDNLEKELKKKVKLPKKAKKIDDIKSEDYDDVSIIAYSQVKKTGIKKTPDLTEIGLSGTKEEKLAFVKENLGKELSIADFIDNGQLVDFRGLTKGKGNQGPVKRFGVTLKGHKSEKGRRRPGSLGPWHPARVIFRVPMAGQMGMFTRCAFNKKVVGISDKENPIEGIDVKTNLKSDYILIEGSVQGPKKRQLILTQPLRATKKQAKKAYELIRVN